MTAAIAGFTLALILFMSFDDDLKSLKALLVGALSGTTLIKAQVIFDSVRVRFSGLETADTRKSSIVFFLSIFSLLFGFVGGFFVIRLGLQRAVAEATSAIKRLVAALPELPTLPWPELREDFPRIDGELPSDDVIAKLAAIEDWTTSTPNEAIRAGAVLLLGEKPEAALRPLRHALATADLPSPLAFDLYATAFVDTYAMPEYLEDTRVREFEKEVARMLSYFPQSFLVNLDVGYLYLYVRGVEYANLALLYTRRALDQRPQSAPANYNMACALAARIRESIGASPSDADIQEIIDHLEKYISREPQNAKTLNSQHDFDQLLQNEHFKAWFQRASGI